MLACLSTIQASGEQADGIPQYRGFPVYPPEAIVGIQEDADYSFDVEVPERTENLEAIAAFDMEQSGVAGLDALMKRTLAPWNAAFRHFEEKGGALGWCKIDHSMYLDGGSQLRGYARVQGDKLELAFVTLWHSSARVSAGKLHVPDHWGVLSYRMPPVEPAPAVHEGFPLPLHSKDPAQWERQDTDLGYKLSIDPAAARGTHTTYVPRCYGWQDLPSQSLRTMQFLWRQGDRFVLFDLHDEQDDRRTTITFFDPEHADQVRNELYPEKLVRSVRVDSGGYMLHGRWLRRPYTIEYDDGHIRINGEEPDCISGTTIEAFDRVVERLRNGDVSFELGRWCSMRVPTLTEAELQESLAQIDAIVASDAPRQTKIDQLTAVPLFKRKSATDLTEVLDNWDGF